MENKASSETALDHQIAQRLRQLRQDRGWSLDELARQSGVSRATLSRLENAEVSPTAQVLSRLCTAHGLTLSRLMQLVEDEVAALVSRSSQSLWTDPDSGYQRRIVSPPAPALAGEVLEASLPPGTRIAYDAPPRPGLEHHLVLLDGALSVTVDGRTHPLRPGDCLRFQLRGPNAYETPPDAGARYLLFLV
ncbi:helix-turn-helix domain-containing protein [Microvirga tunisiensis]|uniref:Helix-turn-helix domain-containing protein n=1 Tax=Pannonibacter tanglangensis TaxID=2750084 RepID=A0A7X5F3W0_9HYPH|nr:XRE family transcriptional regulator [Pannonibacter sp. XCT-53]NBN79258.1 helix-turn-helix domain-containing protein [Pannonibacter sp. XCT-53]